MFRNLRLGVLVMTVCIFWVQTGAWLVMVIFRVCLLGVVIAGYGEL